MINFEYDVIVVGAGHAGCEAACIASTMGAKVLLLTIDMNNIAQLSCNPAMGGIAKGQIVREVDALGGRTGIVSDATSIQFRMLNRSKGPAMWSPRAQLDRKAFVERWIEELQQQENLDIRQDIVEGLIIKDNQVQGVKTQLWGNIFAARVILTVGTFLNGLMHFGSLRLSGGRISEKASYGITEQLVSLGFQAGRMKTGTPARIVGKSVDFDCTELQFGDTEFNSFSFLTTSLNQRKQRPCYIFYTNEECHQILRDSISEAPIYNGQIKSIGPRYCPSIEAKIVTFADRTRHQLFLEPEGENTDEFYLNGFSSSLPLDVQLRALKTIPALRNVKLFRPGYAIEYDYFDPTQLHPSLQSMIYPQLYMAGQINGTTGYEEAAGQGIIAGINAVLSLDGSSRDFVLHRDESYIGVLIDDLVTKGVDEPYRMFTSRAEYRTILRQDTADERLTPYALQFSTASPLRNRLYTSKMNSKRALLEFIENYSVKPLQVNQLLESNGEKPLQQGVKLKDILLRPRISLNQLIATLPELHALIKTLPYYQSDLTTSVEVAVKYAGYIEREKMEADKVKRLENIKLSRDFDYGSIENLKIESRQKLQKILPETLGQASRIPGVSPHDISVLLLWVSGSSVSRGNKEGKTKNTL